MEVIGTIIGVLLGLGFLGILALIGIGALVLIAIWIICDTIKSFAGKKNIKKGEWY